MSYVSNCFCCDIQPEGLLYVADCNLLVLTCSELCWTLFEQIANNEFYSLHYLLPAKRDTWLISRLRSTTVYPTFRARTNRFKNSFLPYCLFNYQWQS